ncbi:MAG: hypothetical protein ACTSQI_07775 [Candidatus Helarchaeota archaeon]
MKIEFICAEKCQINCQITVYNKQKHPLISAPELCVRSGKKIIWIPKICNNCEYYFQNLSVIKHDFFVEQDYKELCKRDNKKTTFDSTCNNWALKSDYFGDELK